MLSRGIRNTKVAWLKAFRKEQHLRRKKQIYSFVCSHYDKNILSSLHQNILSFNLLMRILLRKWLKSVVYSFELLSLCMRREKNCFKEKKPKSYILIAKYTGFQGKWKRFVPFAFSFLSISFRLRHIVFLIV